MFVDGQYRESASDRFLAIPIAAILATCGGRPVAAIDFGLRQNQSSFLRRNAFEVAQPTSSLAVSILVDWGTTNFRAWLVAADGAVLDRRDAAQGIMQVPAGGFPAALDGQVGAWRSAQPELPVLMSGMVGSRQGWAEAPYLSCPAGAEALAGALFEVPGAAGVWIVPGVSYQAPDGRHDVIRGEEVQIFGGLGDRPRGRQVFCLPGTHSKWAAVEDGRIAWFATSMTGEVYSVLADHSILGRLMDDGGQDRTGQDGAAFRQGLELAAEPGGLLNHLFAVRAEGLFGVVPEAGLRSYLSGILIGHEVRAMCGIARPEGPVTLIGRPDITSLYGSAIGLAGPSTQAVTSQDATLKGLSILREAIPAG
jgi:2-dehydro-3-deoxygalactonokinase